MVIILTPMVGVCVCVAEVAIEWRPRFDSTGFGFGVWGLGFGVWGLGFRV